MKHCLLLLTIAAIPASAQWHRFGVPAGAPYEPMQFTGYAGIGFSEPLNPLAHELNSGFNVAGGIGVTRNYFGVMFDAMYTDFGINGATLAQDGATRGHQKYWGLTFDPVFHVNPRGPVDFYVTGGGGLYGQNTDLKSVLAGRGGGFELTNSQTLYGPGVDGGAGFSFSLSNRSRAKFFAEARYHHMFLQGQGVAADFIPVTVGVRF